MISDQLPDLYDIDEAYKTYPDDYNDSMNTVLT